MGRFDDIINEKQPPLRTHMRMSKEARAAQFAPFAAMVGHDAMIAEAMRYVEKRRELDEGEKLVINDALTALFDGGREREILITHFRPDRLKEGGEYITERGIYKKIMLHEGVLVLKNGEEIKIENIVKLVPLDI